MKWSENSELGYYAQDHAHDFADDMDLFAWMNQWGQEKDDEQVIRGTLGRLLFSQKDIGKSVKVISGGAGAHAVRQDHAATAQHPAAG